MRSITQFMQKESTELLKIIDALIERSSNGCYIWRGLLEVARANLIFKKRFVTVRRFMWLFHKGADIPKKVYSTCHIDVCVNPAHLCGGSTIPEKVSELPPQQPIEDKKQKLADAAAYYAKNKCSATVLSKRFKLKYMQAYHLIRKIDSKKNKPIELKKHIARPHKRNLIQRIVAKIFSL